MTYESLKIKKGNPLLLGVNKVSEGYNFAFDNASDSVSLMLYKRGQAEPSKEILLDETYKTGNIFSVVLSGIDFEKYEYVYKVGDEYITDPYTRYITNGVDFGEVNAPKVFRSGIVLADFDWEDDDNPKISYDDMIMYKLHTRGFTKHASSKVKNKGTFAGIVEKLPYIKELGANTIVLMPSYEFFEYSRENTIGAYTNSEVKKLNFWGYTKGLYFAPKYAYCKNSKETDYTVEFKKLVKECHRNGMEVIIELYFDYNEKPAYVMDCIKNWVLEYHVDGVSLCCVLAFEQVLWKDSLLSDTKLIYSYWQASNEYRTGSKHLGNMNDGFMNVTRRFLKGDEDMVRSYLSCVKNNPLNAANINYITNHNTFTLNDLVSYDRKHNEANGENNRDGADYNYSWNCGYEGHTKKKKVVNLRLNQIRSAILLLALSQGTPLIMAGDELLSTRFGNNNPYCEDDEITWLNWRKNTNNQSIYDFYKKALEFRKVHKILHLQDELKGMDYMSCGFPDVSYHSENAWYAHMENYNRHIGVLYCGKYCGDDELIYVAYNMHWEEHKLALPKLSREESWEIVMSTSDGGARIDSKKNIIIAPRTIAVLMIRL